MTSTAQRSTPTLLLAPVASGDASVLHLHLTDCIRPYIINDNKNARVSARAMFSGKVVPLNDQIVSYPDENRQPQSFRFDKFPLTPITDNGETVFAASEVCNPLGLNNISQALSRLDEDEKREIILNDVTGRQQYIWVVTKSGMYSLIGSSRKQTAKDFKRWINHVVLPAIEQNGFYAGPSLSSLDVLKQMVSVLDRQDRAIRELNAHQGQLAASIEDIHEELIDRDYYTVLQWCQKQRIRHTPALLSMWGKAATALSAAENVEIKSLNDGSYNVGRYHKSILSSVCVAKPKTNGQLPLLGTGK